MQRTERWQVRQPGGGPAAAVMFGAPATVAALHRIQDSADRAAETIEVCANCGSPEIGWMEGDYATGVAAPDGYPERGYEAAWHCQTCGAVERWAAAASLSGEVCQ